MDKFSAVWLFLGEDARHSSGVFTEREIAEEWIVENDLTGVLTSYPLNVPIYEWAVNNGFFTPKKDYQKSSKFIGRFSCAGLEHYHYENGKRCSG